MFHFSRKILIPRHKTLDSITFDYCCFHATLPSLYSVSNRESLTISYLTNSCGLSLDDAISASKKISIDDIEKPQSVLQLLISHGFTKSDITFLISKHPRVLSFDPNRNLGPKIEYFKSMGIVGPHLPKFLVSNKTILNSSLKNQIEPAFSLLKGLVLTNENLLYALKQSTRVITCNFEKTVVPNINTLRENGVPEDYIVRLIMLQSASLIWKPDVFVNLVESVKEMSFDPKTMSFVLALRSVCVIGKLRWESKKNIFMNYGWSEDDFRLAFRRQPMFMTCSEKKISTLMDFFVKKLGLKPSEIVRCPNMLLLSLERRIIPRILVLNVLLSKNLLKKGDFDLLWALNRSKKEFDKTFVVDYAKNTPEVMKAYQGAVALEDFVGLSDDIILGSKV